MGGSSELRETLDPAGVCRRREGVELGVWAQGTKSSLADTDISYSQTDRETGRREIKKDRVWIDGWVLSGWSSNRNTQTECCTRPPAAPAELLSSPLLLTPTPPSAHHTNCRCTVHTRDMWFLLPLRPTMFSLDVSTQLFFALHNRLSI